MKILGVYRISYAYGTNFTTQEWQATVEDELRGRLLVFYSVTDCERDEVTEGLPVVNAIVKIVTHASGSDTGVMDVTDEFEYKFTEAWKNWSKLW